MADIIPIGKITDEQKAAWAAAGVDLKERGVDLSALDLHEPQYGEVTAIFTTPEETALFVELHGLTQECNQRERELVATIMTKGGEAVRSGDASRPILEVLSESRIDPFEDDKQAEEFFRLRQRRQYIYDLFYWTVGERTGLHSWRLGVRKPTKGDDRLRVVKIEKRWGSEGT